MSKYDDKAVIKKLKDAFKLGASIEIACGYAGIDETSYYNWQNKALAGDENYINVIQDIKGSMAQGDFQCLEKITQAVQGGVWQAAAWKLERRHPTKYGNNAGMRELNDKMDQLIKERNDGKEAS